MILEIPNHISVEEIKLENFTRIVEGLYRDFDRTYLNAELTILSLRFVFDFIKRVTADCLTEINNLKAKSSFQKYTKYNG